jgi:zinc-ribbon domain
MICERCGKEIADSAAICPSCGTVTSWSTGSSGPPPTTYGGFPTGEYSDTYDQPKPTYEQGYTPRQNHAPQPPPIYTPPPQQKFGPSYAPPHSYQQAPINVTIVNNYTPPPAKNNGALLVEILLSLFGIYGVGWSMAGKKTTGTVLIICSLVYWFLALRFIFLTWGFGILCLGPLSIVLIIVNAILLNNALKQQTARLTTVQAQQMQAPPKQ